jgi:hypothetical protein
MQPVESNPSSTRRQRVMLLVGVITLLALGGGYLMHTHIAHSQTIEQRRAEVAERGAQVMPSDLNLTTHKFTSVPDGGVQTVVANDPSDTTQIQLIRDHLQKEAEKFAAGDFSDPATIHGEDMPGLAQLQAGSDRINVKYELLQNGARLIYSTTDPALVATLHKWFEAQRSDHHAGMQH